VLGVREYRQIGVLSSAESSVLVIAEICMSAFDIPKPMMLVFPRTRENKDLLDNSPPDSTAEYHFSRWIKRKYFSHGSTIFLNLKHKNRK
jgi:hypothetical protein